MENGKLEEPKAQVISGAGGISSQEKFGTLGGKKPENQIIIVLGIPAEE